MILGMLLCELDLLARSNALPHFLQRLDPYKKPIYYLLFVVSILLGGIPSHTCTYTPGVWHLSCKTLEVGAHFERSSSLKIKLTQFSICSGYRGIESITWMVPSILAHPASLLRLQVVLPLLGCNLPRLLHPTNIVAQSLLRMPLQPIPRPHLLRIISSPRTHYLDTGRQTIRSNRLV